jgi:hypothetical protein
MARLLPDCDLGRGWRAYRDVVCPGCGHIEVVLIPVGAMGFGCSECSYIDPLWYWAGPVDQPGDGGIMLGTINWGLNNG